MEKANLSLYTGIVSPRQIQEEIRRLFAPVSRNFQTDGGRYILTLQDGSEIRFHLSHSDTDAAFMEMHLSGMYGCFARTDTGNKEIKKNFLKQVKAFNAVTGIVFEIDGNDTRTHFIINTLFDLAQATQGLLLYPGMRIYDGKGRLVFSSKGESSLESFTPILPETVEKQEIPETDGFQEKVPSPDIKIRSRREMVESAVTFFAIAVYSEVMLSDKPDREEAMNYFNALDAVYGLSRWMTPSEKEFIADPDSSETERIEHMWHYETCATLLWAAGILEELPYPREICDAPVIAGIIWQNRSIEDLLSKGGPRSEKEILDAAGQTYRYQETCTRAQREKKKCPDHLDTNVVMERYYSFLWLTCSQAPKNL